MCPSSLHAARRHESRPLWRNVTGVGLRAALLATVLAALSPAPARADDIQAKISYCKDCHGPSAQGYRGFPIPRLAGQHPNIWKINCEPSSSIAAPTISCSTWLML